MIHPKNRKLAIKLLKKELKSAKKRLRVVKEQIRENGLEQRKVATQLFEEYGLDDQHGQQRQQLTKEKKDGRT